MKVTPTKLPEVLLIEPKIFEDARGHFLETYQADRYRDCGVPARFVQDNLSYSHHGVLRGLHYQLGRPQGKLVWPVQGRIFDVVVDIRKSSPRFGQWISMELDCTSCSQLYVPEGFAHGFCVLSAEAVVIYKCTDYYAPVEERGIIWNDTGLGIDWPVKDPILSPKDLVYPTLQLAGRDQLPD
ncbi:MAG: dTDP-4-dehydrorhamnose 3,5-epimerase [Deltaproteobacteria bacterium]|nr:MAG: dTDP-4-dehydrorhamnose 3,5-epimerase [Deltaproteobacteria bacterium]